MTDSGLIIAALVAKHGSAVHITADDLTNAQPSRLSRSADGDGVRLWIASAATEEEQ